MTPPSWCRRAAITTAAAVVIAASAACGEPRQDSEPAADGPVRMAQSAGELCLPAGAALEIAYGQELLTNGGDAPATIDRVALVDPTGMTLVESFVVPMTSRTMAGSWSQWPPPPARRPPIKADWAHRADAAGFVIEPDARRAVKDLNLVLHARRTGAGSDAGMAGVRVDYSIGSARHYVVSPLRVHVKQVCRPPT